MDNPGQLSARRSGRATVHGLRITGRRPDDWRPIDEALLRLGATYVELPTYAVGLGRWALVRARRQTGRPTGGGPDAGGPLGPARDR